MTAAALDRIVRQFGFIGPLGETVQGWLGAQLGQGRLAGTKELLNGRWLGHPLHPVLTDLPIGAWTGATLLDLADRGAGGGMAQAADLLLEVGCLGGVAAAASGIADWQDKLGQERDLGTAHALVNSAALALFSGSLVLRWMGARRAGVGVSLLGMGAAVTGAYVGGDLVFRLGSQVNRNAFSSGPRKWRELAEEAEVVEGSFVTKQVAGRRVLLTRLEGRICAAGAVCSHAGGPLDELPLEDGVLRCPWHGSRFDLVSGRVLHGPATIENPVFEARVEAGKVEIRLPEP